MEGASFVSREKESLSDSANQYSDGETFTDETDVKIRSGKQCVFALPSCCDKSLLSVTKKFDAQLLIKGYKTLLAKRKMSFTAHMHV